MTSTQAQIIELITQLSLSERRELFAHLKDAHILEESFYERMTDAQRAELDAAIAEADAGQVSPAEDVFKRIAGKFGFAHS